MSFLFPVTGRPRSMRPKLTRPGDILARLLFLLLVHAPLVALAGEPDPRTYWDVKDIRPGMKGTGKTVMVGTKLEEFGAEVLGVMKDVNPGRDMVLCRLTGCNLEHAGIIQGMSGSPIYIDGKLLGAVAYAWEFAKDPIAGVTPFQQMVRYVRANDRRIAAEAREPIRGNPGTAGPARAWIYPDLDDPPADRPVPGSAGKVAVAVSGGGMAGMVPIVTPMAAAGFSPRALAMLETSLRPLGMAPMAGGAAAENVIKEAGDRPLVPGLAAVGRHGPGRFRPLRHRHRDAR